MISDLEPRNDHKVCVVEARHVSIAHRTQLQQCQAVVNAAANDVLADRLDELVHRCLVQPPAVIPTTTCEAAPACTYRLGSQVGWAYCPSEASAGTTSLHGITTLQGPCNAPLGTPGGGVLGGDSQHIGLDRVQRRLPQQPRQAAQQFWW